jgi:hypothetical protein
MSPQEVLPMARFPSPSLAVSMLALVVALGGAGYSATGGSFILGNTNVASTPTVLQGAIGSRTLQVNNGSSAAGATALTLSVLSGHAPMTVNSSVRVANLNADKLDGLDAANLARRQVIPFNLAAGADSAPIALPALVPVSVLGAMTTYGDPDDIVPVIPGAGPVTIIRHPVAPLFNTWPA